MRDLEAFQRRVLVRLVFFLARPVELVEDGEDGNLRDDILLGVVWVEGRGWQVTCQIHERNLLHLLCTTNTCDDGLTNECKVRIFETYFMHDFQRVESQPYSDSKL